jgi:hypothetical protein
MGKEQSLSVLLSQILSTLKNMSVSYGCDYITGTDANLARKGKITSMIVNEDSTGITSFIENINGVETSVTSRSYITIGNNLKVNTLIVFDAPVTSITLAAGSAYVYYKDI